MSGIKGDAGSISPECEFPGHLPALYVTASLIDRTRHGSLRFAPQSNFGFARRTNSLPVVLSEFDHLAQFCPLAFVNGSDGDPIVVAVLGFGNGENLFVDRDLRWTGPYIPAWLRRYPFLLAQAGTVDSAQFVLAADLTAKHFVDPEGEPVFRAEGTSDAIGHALGFCLRFESEMVATRDFCRTVAAAGLLTADREEHGGSALSFLSIDHRALGRKRPKQLSEWRENGILAATLAILASQRRWRELAALRR